MKFPTLSKKLKSRRIILITTFLAIIITFFGSLILYAAKQKQFESQQKIIAAQQLKEAEAARRQQKVYQAKLQDEAAKDQSIVKNAAPLDSTQTTTNSYASQLPASPAVNSSLGNRPKVTKITLSNQLLVLRWSSYMITPENGYILYWSKLGCTTKPQCVWNESEFPSENNKVLLDNSIHSYTISTDFLTLSTLAMICENVNGSCGVRSNTLNILPPSPGGP